MSAPIRPDNISQLLADHARRIRALEAKRPSGGFGESMELENPNQVITGTETLDWVEVYDPHGFFNGGSSSTVVTVPNGLSGLYHICIVFATGGE